MPKIRDTTLGIEVKGNRKKWDVTIHYSSEHKFYISVPNEINLFVYERVQLGDRQRLGYEKFRGRGEDICAVTAPSEQSVQDRFKELANLVLAVEVDSRPVILVSYSSEQYSHNDRTNDNHPKIGFHISLFYCTETSMAGMPPSYTYEQMFIRDMQTYVYNKGRYETVIADTPENRAFLEDLYSKSKNLIDNFDKFLGDTDALTGLIASNQKLIG